MCHSADPGALCPSLCLSVSLSLSDCACVQFGDFVFTDHLSMLLLGDEAAGQAKWMIVHKTFVPSGI